jgi:hypothetical protein
VSAKSSNFIDAHIRISVAQLFVLARVLMWSFSYFFEGVARLVKKRHAGYQAPQDEACLGESAISKKAVPLLCFFVRLAD